MANPRGAKVVSPGGGGAKMASSWEASKWRPKGGAKMAFPVGAKMTSTGRGGAKMASQGGRQNDAYGGAPFWRPRGRTKMTP